MVYLCVSSKYVDIHLEPARVGWRGATFMHIIIYKFVINSTNENTLLSFNFSKIIAIKIIRLITRSPNLISFL